MAGTQAGSSSRDLATSAMSMIWATRTGRSPVAAEEVEVEGAGAGVTMELVAKERVESVGPAVEGVTEPIATTCSVWGLMILFTLQLGVEREAAGAGVDAASTEEGDTST